MSNRYLQRKTSEQIAWEAVEGAITLEDAAAEFADLDWCESALSYLIPEAQCVEQLAGEPPQSPKERADLEEKVRAFFWSWVEQATNPTRDKPVATKISPL